MPIGPYCFCSCNFRSKTTSHMYLHLKQYYSSITISTFSTSKLYHGININLLVFMPSWNVTFPRLRHRLRLCGGNGATWLVGESATGNSHAGPDKNEQTQDNHLSKHMFFRFFGFLSFCWNYTSQWNNLKALEPQAMKSSHVNHVIYFAIALYAVPQRDKQYVPAELVWIGAWMLDE